MHCSSISTSMLSITRSPLMTRWAFSLSRSSSASTARLSAASASPDIVSSRTLTWLSSSWK